MIAGLVRRLLDRLPHDTLYIGGAPYMHRWYVIGYAPVPDNPDGRMICATCRLDVQQGDRSGLWWHVGHGAPIQNQDHSPSPVSAPRSGWWWNRGWAIRVHETVASDDSRAFHDHPWPFVSIGLHGTYVEERPGHVHVVDGVPVDCSSPGAPENTLHTYQAPFVNVKAATDLHVLSVADGPVWTVFCTLRKERSWGFAGPFGWRGWRTFDAEFPERDAWTEGGAR